MPSEEFRRVLEVMRAMPRVDPTTVAVEQVRSGMELATSHLAAPEATAFEVTDAGGVAAEWTRPPGVSEDVTLLYHHGGGYCAGSPRTHRALVGHFAREIGARALSVDYRLAPEHPFPAALEDALRAYRWVLAGGTSPRQVVVGGDSAGGGLTLALLLALRDAGEPLPAAAVLVSPWTDLTGSGESLRSKVDVDPMVRPEGLHRFAGFYAGAAERGGAALSPLFADLTGLPPVLIQVGTAECLLDDSTRLADRLQTAGVDVTLRIYDDMIHVFQILVMIPEAREAAREVGAFCQRHLARQ